jgi:hypothetical protein
VEKVKADKTEKTEKAEKTQKTAEQKPVAATPPPAASAFVPFSTLGYGYDVPRMEFSAGYSFMNTGTSGLTNRENMSGVEGSVTYNLTRRYAAEANVGAYFKTLQITNLGTFGFHDYTAMGGGRVNIRKAFAHALVGLDHISGSNTFFAAGSSASDNALAAAVGGGVQWSISPRMALRTSGDYVVSRFEGLTQNNIRLSFGLVFQSGSIYGRRGE